MSFVSQQIIFENVMSMWDVNSDNIYELSKLKLMTPPNSGCGDASDKKNMLQLEETEKYMLEVKAAEVSLCRSSSFLYSVMSQTESCNC